MKKVLPYILSFMMLSGALGHIIAPQFYDPMIPEFFPKTLANIAATASELLVGILLLLPKYKHWGGLGFLLLMTGFLPIHIWDALRINPAIGQPPIPLIRIAFQFVLIYAGWWVFKIYRKAV